MAFDTDKKQYLGVTYLLSDETGLSDTAQLTSGTNPVTARIITTNVAGTLSLVDYFGNISPHILAAGESVVGLYNGIRTTGTATIAATDVVVHA